jgi:hypothetical protein
MTIIKFEWSPLDRCYDIPPFYINKKNDLCTGVMELIVANSINGGGEREGKLVTILG